MHPHTGEVHSTALCLPAWLAASPSVGILDHRIVLCIRMVNSSGGTSESVGKNASEFSTVRRRSSARISLFGSANSLISGSVFCPVRFCIFHQLVELCSLSNHGSGQSFHCVTVNRLKGYGPSPGSAFNASHSSISREGIIGGHTSAAHGSNRIYHHDKRHIRL